MTTYPDIEAPTMPTGPLAFAYTRVMSAWRHRAMRRQWKYLRKALDSFADPTKRALAAYVHTEATKAQHFPLPAQFYRSDAVPTYWPWGNTLDKAFAQAKSDDLQVKLQGIALWLVVVHAETAGTRHPGLSALREEIKPLYTALHALHSRTLAIRNTRIKEAMQKMAFYPPLPLASPNQATLNRIAAA